MPRGCPDEMERQGGQMSACVQERMGKPESVQRCMRRRAQSSMRHRAERPAGVCLGSRASSSAPYCGFRQGGTCKAEISGVNVEGALCLLLFRAPTARRLPALISLLCSPSPVLLTPSPTQPRTSISAHDAKLVILSPHWRRTGEALILNQFAVGDESVAERVYSIEHCQ